MSLSGFGTNGAGYPSIFDHSSTEKKANFLISEERIVRVPFIHKYLDSKFFILPQKVIKSNDTRDIELTRDKKFRALIWVLPVIEHV